MVSVEVTIQLVRELLVDTIQVVFMAIEELLKFLPEAVTLISDNMDGEDRTMTAIISVNIIYSVIFRFH